MKDEWWTPEDTIADPEIVTECKTDRVTWYNTLTLLFGIIMHRNIAIRAKLPK